MRTLKIFDGLLYTDPTTGQWSIVEGPTKSSQDVARHVLTTYVPQFSEGNSLMNVVLGPSTGGVVTTALVTTYLTEAVNRLIIKQSSSTDTDRVMRINRLVVQAVSTTVSAFYLEVGLINNGRSSITQFISLKPTSLEHLLNADAIVKV